MGMAWVNRYLYRVGAVEAEHLEKLALKQACLRDERDCEMWRVGIGEVGGAQGWTPENNVNEA
jgi:hypothetical protein